MEISVLPERYTFPQAFNIEGGGNSLIIFGVGKNYWGLEKKWKKKTGARSSSTGRTLSRQIRTKMSLCRGGQLIRPPTKGICAGDPPTSLILHEKRSRGVGDTHTSAAPGRPMGLKGMVLVCGLMKIYFQSLEKKGKRHTYRGVVGCINIFLEYGIKNKGGPCGYQGKWTKNEERALRGVLRHSLEQGRGKNNN